MPPARRRSVLRWTLAGLDLLAAAAAYTVLFTFRIRVLEPDRVETYPWQDDRFVAGVVVIAVAWIIFYRLTGTYRRWMRSGRLELIGRTLWQTLVGSVALFFILFLNDRVPDYTAYYRIFAVYAGSHLALTISGRLVALELGLRGIIRGRYRLRTVLVGRADEVSAFVEEAAVPARYHVVGYVTTEDAPSDRIGRLACLGVLDDVDGILDRVVADDVIIAVRGDDHDRISRVLGHLSTHAVVVHILPGLYDILAGWVRMDEIGDSPFIEIDTEIMPAWRELMKRVMDVVASALALIVLAPLFVWIAWRVRRSSPGPVIFRQQRVGRYGRPFTMYKFRSMQPDAEPDGPALAVEDDPRITDWGRVMRKWRLDELPQFWNILRGDMALVGPRPERQYYIDLLADRAPHCKHLQRLRPGLTSLGMVKYGYAENVDQMLDRMRYDLIYLRDPTLVMDLRILLYTLGTLFAGKGQ